MTITNDDIACYGVGEWIFFSDLAADEDAAKAICETCSVRAWCLQIAIDRGEEGVWGGFTETDRRLYVRLYGRDVGDEVQELDLRALIAQAS